MISKGDVVCRGRQRQYNEGQCHEFTVHKNWRIDDYNNISAKTNAEMKGVQLRTRKLRVLADIIRDGGLRFPTGVAEMGYIAILSGSSFCSISVP